MGSSSVAGCDRQGEQRLERLVARLAEPEHEQPTAATVSSTMVIAARSPLGCRSSCAARPRQPRDPRRVRASSCDRLLGGGELEEQLLEARALGGLEAREGHAAVEAPRGRPPRARRRRCSRRRRRGRRSSSAAASAQASASSSVARTSVPVAASSSSRAPCAAISPAADDHQLVGDRLDLGEQVGGEQHGAAAVGEVAQQAAHPAHPLRVEPVGGLVEDQHLRLADQRVGDARAAGACRASTGARACARRPCRARRARAARRRDAAARPSAGRTARAPRGRGGRGAGRRRRAGRRRAARGWGAPRTGRPARLSCPACGSESPQIIRIVVVLPAPLGPRNPVTVPGSQRNETSETTVRPPSRFVSPCASIMATASAFRRRSGHRRGSKLASTSVGGRGPSADVRFVGDEAQTRRASRSGPARCCPPSCASRAAAGARARDWLVDATMVVIALIISLVGPRRELGRARRAWPRSRTSWSG